MEVHLSPELQAKLDKLATDTGRSQHGRKTEMKRVLHIWLLTAAISTPMHAQFAPSFKPADEIQTSNLKGLKAVGVIVAELDANLQRGGLIKDEIKADTEMRLKESGIGVLSGKERLKSPGRPYLYIAIESVCPSTTNLCTVDVAVRVIESIQLERDSTIQTNASIWEKDILTMLEKKHLDKVRDMVSAFVDQFKTALRSTNP